MTQWRSKSLRGPGSTVIWGPSVSLPYTSPFLAFPSLFPSSSPAQPLPLPRRGPKSSKGVWGSAVSSPAGSRGRAPGRGSVGRSPPGPFLTCKLGGHSPPPNPARGLGSAVSFPAGSGAEPQPKSNLVHFSLIIRHLMATILMIFLRVLRKINFSVAPLLGSPRSSGAPVH